MIASGAIPPDAIGLFADDVSLDVADLQAWFRHQLEAGGISGLNDVPRDFDPYSESLMVDPTIRRSMEGWLHVDGERGASDGSLISDADMDGRQWTNAQRRLVWLNSFAANAVEEGEEFTEEQLDYLTSLYREAHGCPVSFNGVSGALEHLRASDRFALAPYATGLLALSNTDLGGDDDRLPLPIRDAIDSDSDERYELEELLRSTSRPGPLSEGSRLGAIVEFYHVG